jgi:phenylacetic acid degradation protein
MAFVRSGFTCPERSMVVGSPARVIRSVREDEIQWKSQGTREYQQLSSRCLLSLERAEPLAEAEPRRPRIEISGFKPKNQE